MGGKRVRQFFPPLHRPLPLTPPPNLHPLVSTHEATFAATVWLFNIVRKGERKRRTKNPKKKECARKKDREKKEMKVRGRIGEEYKTIKTETRNDSNRKQGERDRGRRT